MPAQAPLSVQYADYALWQQAALGSVHDPSSPIGSQMDYWRTQLAALPIVTDLPRDRQRPSVRDSDAGVVRLTGDDAFLRARQAMADDNADRFEAVAARAPAGTPATSTSAAKTIASAAPLPSPRRIPIFR